MTCGGLPMTWKCAMKRWWDRVTGRYQVTRSKEKKGTSRYEGHKAGVKGNIGCKGINRCTKAGRVRREWVLTITQMSSWRCCWLYPLKGRLSQVFLSMLGSPVLRVQLGELLATQPAAAIATETCCSLNLPLLFSFSKFKCTVSYWHLYFILNTKRKHSFIQNNLLGLIFLSRNGGKLLWRQRLFRNGKYSEKSQGNHTFII